MPNTKCKIITFDQRYCIKHGSNCGTDLLIKVMRDITKVLEKRKKLKMC